MSWLSIPLPNPFKSLQFSNEEEDEDEQEEPRNDAVSGVKEEFTAIGESIGRQFRAFISPETSNSGDGGSPSSRTFEGIRSDLEEIKGTFKSSLSIFSSNKAVSEISKLASNFLHINDEENNVNNMISNDRNYNDGDDYEDDDEEEEVAGVNDEVIEFAQQISNRPELWTEFPLSLDHEFDMSEAQYEHASTVEQLVPSLAELKSQISSDKREKQFWMIYFILLHPRLNNDEDLELLSTPEIVEARETLLTMLQAKKSKDISSENPQSGSSNNEGDIPMINSQSAEDVTTSENSNASESVKGTESNNSKKILEAEDGCSFSFNDHNESDAKPDKWEEKEKSVSIGTSAAAPKQFQSEDDVSFSDLEDDDNDLPNRLSSSGPSQSKGTSSPEGSNEWVRLNENVEVRGSEVKGHSTLRDRDSEGEDSTGWLTVDDFDP
ncbi:putative uncharacterized protein DDB_G0289963 [Chenopodium quinoa]|uniref:putative uncharacterized protein DDB_G0289963 n=1 Tax=Chenopodium quinoa TaxID=63459 RepID=UPI000B76D5AA|nr:putative uncharacterized protein DDB_G0289963 [Chenopodium quinoa]